MGLGRRRKIVSQQAAPPIRATQIVSALPVAPMTLKSAGTAPMQIGRSTSATSNLTHLGTGLLYKGGRPGTTTALKREERRRRGRKPAKSMLHSASRVSGLLWAGRAALQYNAESALSFQIGR